MAVGFTDNSKQILSAFEKQVERALEAIGQTAEGYAKDDCREAARYINGDESSICKVRNGKRKSAYGYYWEVIK